MQQSAVAFETITCPICEGREFIPLFEKRGEPFVRCVDCSLVLINPRPTRATVALTYDEKYSQNYINKAAKKLARSRRWVQRIARRFVPRGRWLDVGCSAGFVVAAAEEAGFEAFGVELEAAAIDYGRRELGLVNLACGTLEAQHYPAAHFEVISLYDVIEHVPDLGATLTELARIVKAQGVIEIRTPDVGHWRTPKDLARWKEIKPSEHLYYFSRSTLQRLFATHGFELAERRWMTKTALNCVFKRTA